MNYYKSAKLLSWSCNMATLEMRLFNAAIAVFQEVGKLPIKIPYTLLNEVFEGWNKKSTLRAIECIDLREFVTQQGEKILVCTTVCELTDEYILFHLNQQLVPELQPPSIKFICFQEFLHTLIKKEEAEGNT